MKVLLKTAMDIAAHPTVSLRFGKCNPIPISLIEI